MIIYEPFVYSEVALLGVIALALYATCKDLIHTLKCIFSKENYQIVRNRFFWN